ncbi:hypothetical protein [Candidatus Contubernalis alkaliaceticus]|uniref:hypothetical protein n=1 Tax=Candidatus Contubernalis alkaliaceticus TaxID=338645 RepID=UPI001F4C3758|nr:hypothetical protein [Candidatus Contubernalis alkalaceticus]UNC91680.1 hypothetical protein HUE98_05980 [Candidatus Contubernalis alkalaceticus]
MIELSEFWQGMLVGGILGMAVTWFLVALMDIGQCSDLESENTYLKLKLKEVIEGKEITQELKGFFRSSSLGD